MSSPSVDARLLVLNGPELASNVHELAGPVLAYMREEEESEGPAAVAPLALLSSPNQGYTDSCLVTFPYPGPLINGPSSCVLSIGCRFVTGICVLASPVSISSDKGDALSG